MGCMEKLGNGYRDEGLGRRVMGSEGRICQQPASSSQLVVVPLCLPLSGSVGAALLLGSTKALLSGAVG